MIRWELLIVACVACVGDGTMAALYDAAPDTQPSDAGQETSASPTNDSGYVPLSSDGAVFDGGYEVRWIADGGLVDPDVLAMLLADAGAE